MLLEHDTAGDPMTGLKWSRRTTDKIAALLAADGIFVSSNTVARLLHQMGYSLRVNHKMLPTDSSPDRDRQFEYISELRTGFQHRRHPIISVSTEIPLYMQVVSIEAQALSLAQGCVPFLHRYGEQVAHSFCLSRRYFKSQLLIKKIVIDSGLELYMIVGQYG